MRRPDELQHNQRIREYARNRYLLRPQCANRFVRVLIGATITLTITGPAVAAPPGPPVPIAMPINFQANRGQFDPAVAFYLPQARASLFRERPVAMLDVPASSAGPGATITVRLVGATPSLPRGEDRAAGSLNFLYGSDPRQWRVDIPHFRQVRYPNVYPGVDWVTRTASDGLRYDFEVDAGIDPATIRIAFDGLDKMTLQADGHLDLEANGHHIQQRKPRAFQQVHGSRVEVPTHYTLLSDNEIGIAVARVDPHASLLIDPTLVYSSYIGEDLACCVSVSRVAVDPKGNIFVSASGFLPATATPLQNKSLASNDVFIVKLSPDGQKLIFATYLGGSSSEDLEALAVDDLGYAYIAGETSSADFPTTPGAFQTAPKAKNFSISGFVTKLSVDGKSLVWSTRIGGTDQVEVADIALYRERGSRSEWSVYLTGATGCYSQKVLNKIIHNCKPAGDFPTTPGAVQTAHSGQVDGFALRLSPDGSHLVFSTFLGGSQWDTGQGIAVDSAGRAYVVGRTDSKSFKPTAQKALKSIYSGSVDGFIVRLAADGTAADFSTYIGSAGLDYAQAVALDEKGAVYVTGATSSDDFGANFDASPIPPAVPEGSSAPEPCDKDGMGTRNVFVLKLRAQPTSWTLVYVNTFGANCTIPADIAVTRNNAWITGQTYTPDFPTTSDAFLPTGSPGSIRPEAFLTELSSDGKTLQYSTFLTGSSSDQGDALAVGPNNNVYVSGRTYSDDFRVTGDAFQLLKGGLVSAFVMRFRQ